MSLIWVNLISKVAQFIVAAYWLCVCIMITVEDIIGVCVFELFHDFIYLRSSRFLPIIQCASPMTSRGGTLVVLAF